ncbi:hypothetical protein Y032_0030g2068 [Ancylostoma ceylanicum]|uniref:Eukaryotic translation initiation factor 3 subunit B n=1 Tax=Ancylostoma ceylanicum TaxID=53326 RepID=A0A016UPY8_9BILA|nr:hypothetical protein Y032_0030g2068 [Ancylostoma ceylanicum]
MVEIDINKENEEEPSFSDPEDYVDDIADEDLVMDVLRQQPSKDEYEEACLMIFGIPVVGPERVGKLRTVLTKVFTNVEPDHKAHFPLTEDGGSKGCVFIEFPDKVKAEYAKGVLNGYKLDKNHVFSALLFNEARHFQKPQENWQPPKPTPYNDVGDLWWWMQHPRCRDQFAVQYEKDGVPTVACYWHIKGHDPEIAGEPGKAERPSWTDTVFKWSPHGSYLTTIHKRGVALWGGPEFSRVQRFAHENVQFIDFSPCETYLVTYAEAAEKNHWGDDEDCLRIWDVVTGEMLKGFSLYALTNRDQLPCWPFFQWSFDEKFFACLKAPEKDKLEKEKKVNGISVFETETFKLVDRRHIIVENIKTFSWSPTANIISYYAECTDSLPAEFGLVQMPNQQRLRSGRIHNVADAQMFWQKSGQRLAVYTMRYSKKQMKEGGEVKYVGGCTYHIEIFEIDKKDVSLMNLPLPEPFINFGWQPYGEKFCVLTGNQAKATPLVYRIEANSHAPKLMSKLDAGVQFNEVSWAPAGGWLAVLAKRSTGGNVMFVDTTLQEAKRTNVVEHPGFNKGYWDPTGRYFVTCSTLGGRMGADLGFRLYTFQGRELCRKGLERLSQFKWRPRPPVKLSDQKLKEIKNNLKKTAVRFEREDNEEKNRASQEVVEKRRKIMAAFDVIRQRNLKKIAAQKDLRISLRDGVDTDNAKEQELVEEQIMVALDTQKTLAPLGEDELD